MINQSKSHPDYMGQLTIEDFGDFLRRSYGENWRLWCVGEGGSTMFAKREKNLLVRVVEPQAEEEWGEQQRQILIGNYVSNKTYVCTFMLPISTCNTKFKENQTNPSTKK